MSLFSLFSAFLAPPQSIHSDVTPTLQPSPTSADIPLEIVMIILELLYYNHHPLIDTAILNSCSLVCRSWALPAQRLLFRHVTLQNQNALESFVDAIDRSTPRGCALGDAVSRIRVIMDHNQPSGIHQHSFALCVSLCPNLTRLSLSLYGCAAPGKDIVGSPDQLRMRRPAPLFDEQTVQLLTSGPAITDLEFNNWSENEQATNQVSQLWPALRSLAISGTTPQLSPGPSDPFPCALEALRLNFQTAPSNDYLKWLLYRSSDSLRVLEFDREPSMQLLEYLLTSHRATLRALSLPSISSKEQASVIRDCYQLRELRTETPSALPLLYRKLPESLEHMAFGMDRDSALNPVLEAVKSRSSLKTVTVQLWNGAELHTHLSKLRIECAWRGLELTATNNVRLFRLMRFATNLISN